MLGLFLLLVLLVSGAGLKVKLPFVQKVNSIVKRILEWNGSPSGMPTKDKLYISVDLFARWRIIDPFSISYACTMNAAPSPVWMILISSRHCRKRFPAVQLRQPLEIGRQHGIQVLFPKSPSPVSLCLTGPIHAGFSPHSE